MVTDIHLRIEPEFYKKIQKKSKKGSYKNVQEYFLALAHRDIFMSNPNAGRKKAVDTVDRDLDRFSISTKATKDFKKKLKKEGVSFSYS